MQIARDLDHCRTAADVRAAARAASVRRRIAFARREELPQEPATIRVRPSRAKSPRDITDAYAAWAAGAFPLGLRLSQPVDYSRSITVKRILLVATEHFGVTHVELCSPRRSQIVADYRACVYWCARELTARSLPAIGHDIGGRDHTTILSGVRKVERSIASAGQLGDMAHGLRDAVIARFSLVKPSAPIIASMGVLFPLKSQEQST